MTAIWTPMFLQLEEETEAAIQRSDAVRDEEGLLDEGAYPCSPHSRLSMSRSDETHGGGRSPRAVFLGRFSAGGLVCCCAVVALWLAVRAPRGAPPSALRHDGGRRDTVGLQLMSPVSLDRAKLVMTVSGKVNMQWQPDVEFEPDFDFEGPVLEVGSFPDGPPLEGFGGAFTEAAAVVFEKLNPQLQEEFLSMYFGPDGLGYTLGRVHINSCDFSQGNYAFDDVPGDFDMSHFDMSLARDSTALIPMIQRAQAMVETTGRSLQLLASPWSPPGWMKGNGQMDHSGEACLRSGPEYKAAWARYISRWISAYETHGIPIWAVTVQNEPLNDNPFESCRFSAADEAAFLAEHLGPTLRARHPQVGIFIFDQNKDSLLSYAAEVLRNPQAAEYATGVAFHWYTGDHFDDIWALRNMHPEKTFIASEATFEKHSWKWGQKSTYVDWRFGEGYAHDIIGDLNAGAAAWIDWNLLLNVDGGPNHVGNVCDATMIGDTVNQKLWPHPQWFYLGHFTKFLFPGSRKMPTTATGTPRYAGVSRQYGDCTNADGLEAVTFLRPDDQVATIVLNCGSEAVNFKLKVGACAIRASIPSHAIQTYLYSHGVCSEPDILPDIL